MNAAWLVRIKISTQSPGNSFTNMNIISKVCLIMAYGKGLWVNSERKITASVDLLNFNKMYVSGNSLSKCVKHCPI